MKIITQNELDILPKDLAKALVESDTETIKQFWAELQSLAHKSRAVDKIANAISESEDSWHKSVEFLNVLIRKTHYYFEIRHKEAEK